LIGFIARDGTTKVESSLSVIAMPDPPVMMPNLAPATQALDQSLRMPASRTTRVHRAISTGMSSAKAPGPESRGSRPLLLSCRCTVAVCSAAAMSVCSLVSIGARDDVDRAAGGEGHDDADRPARKGLGHRQGGAQSGDQPPNAEQGCTAPESGHYRWREILGSGHRGRSVAVLGYATIQRQPIACTQLSYGLAEWRGLVRTAERNGFDWWR